MFLHYCFIYFTLLWPPPIFSMCFKVFKQWVPDSRASNRKRPTAVRAEPVAWYGELVTAGRTQTLAENDVRNWWTVVHQIPRSLVVLASVHEYAELVLDSFWNVKPLKLSVHQSWQTMIKLPRISSEALLGGPHYEMVLITRRLSTGPIIRDLEWPWMVILC